MLKFLTWLPSFSDLQKHADRGIDGIVVNQRLINGTFPQFEGRCKELNLGFWRYPASLMEPPVVNILKTDGLTILDEPVLHGWTPEQWKAQAIKHSTILTDAYPVLGNLEGDKFARDLSTFRPAEIETLKAYFAVPDILLCDFYGWSRVRYNPDKSFLDWYTNKALFKAFANMIALAPKTTTLGVTIEAANQRLDPLSRAPTVQEFRESLWVPFIMGAKVFMIFTQSPGGKQPTYEVYGNSNDAMPPELELEFRLNKPRLLEVDSWGQRQTQSIVGDSDVIGYDGGRKLSFDHKTYNVVATQNGSTLWSLTNQSSYRKFSSAIAVEQTEALKQITDLINVSTMETLKKENVVLKGQLSQIRAILGASS